ncbi:MAG: response regulator, partial [Myxococcota bacterium]
MSLNSGAARVLFVEDDLKLRGLLEEYFRQQGFETCSVGDGESALERARTQEFDLVVLDVMIPGPDGYEVCREIRTFFDGGILMLTARRGEQEQIVGLDLGADDYVTKPVDPTLLVARMRSLLRRVRRLGPAQEGPI